MDDAIVSLYPGGMTVRGIQAHLARTVGSVLSHEAIAHVTDAVLEQAKAWQSGLLDAVWPVVFLDAIVVRVCDGAYVVNRAAHIALGADGRAPHPRGLRAEPTGVPGLRHPCRALAGADYRRSR